jgi:hypothetical protein
MDCHKILALSGGSVVEYAAPGVLLGVQPQTQADIVTRQPTLFQALVSETGPETAKMLTDIVISGGVAGGFE